MKKLFIIITAILSAVSCANLDEVWEELREHEERIERLETECRRLSSNIEAVQTVLEAIQKNDYATAVTKIMEDGVEVAIRLHLPRAGLLRCTIGMTSTLHRSSESPTGFGSYPSTRAIPGWSSAASKKMKSTLPK